ncbi:permease-like cell division protein FtsX [Edaphobacillus lindanitolerans]|uniref:Cell division protein FtsX n=1 Tax=Edaphobacillus lindanitolerans TaxID=550447 RepID=A0A1U7PHQ1_9BACI|nr:permease-like cell division protein FtsX [Edaphobacillus lindanitolerans]SIT69093.1 cell division transport system permease protein [Edaphobacillus lindanitolerans]
MKFRTVRRHFRESFKTLGRNGWMSFASIAAVTVTLLLVGVFVTIMLNLNKVADDLEKDVEMKVYVELSADPAATRELETQIKETSGVAEVQYSTRDQELDKMVKDFGEDLKLYEQSNPLREAFYVKATEPQQTAKVAKKIDEYPNTYEVVYGQGKVEKLFNFLNLGRNAGLVLILALLFTAMFLIANTIRITIVARKTEIGIMKLVGATNSFVRIPFVLEGIWLGLFGSLIPMIIITLGYMEFYDYAEPRLRGEMIQIIHPLPFLYIVNGLVLFMGIFIGSWGSFMSVRKFLKV